MIVEFSCPRCGKAYSLGSGLAGRLAKCKQCETVMVVPGLVEPVAVPPEPVRKETKARRPTPPTPRTRPPEPPRESPRPPDPFGVEDIPALPHRFEIEPTEVRRSRKASRHGRAFLKHLSKLEFGHFALVWWITMLGLFGLSFYVDDGSYRCSQLMFWLGALLLPIGLTWFPVTAFQEDLARGVLVVVLPVYGLYHLFDSWSETRRPFWTGFAGFVSITAGCLLYAYTGDDLGERGLMAFPGSEASRRIVIDEKDLPIRPPEVSEELTEEQALANWQAFSQKLQDDSNLKPQSRIRLLANRKRKAMVKAHSEEAIVIVSINLVLDGATFDKVEAALRPFAGSGPDDFFAYSATTTKNSATMTVVLSPVTDRQALLRSLNFGAGAYANPSGQVIIAGNAPSNLPPQLQSLVSTGKKVEPSSKTLGEQLAGKSPSFEATAPGRAAEPPPPPRTLTELPSTGDLELPYPSGGGFVNTIYPSTNSRFVAIGNSVGTGGYRESWDLKERRRIGVIAGQIPLYNRLVLSPDGTSIAGVTADQQAVEIWSFETGRLIRRIDGNTIVNFVDYVGPDRVVISTPFQRTYYVTEIASGRGIKTIVSPVHIDAQSVGIAPDGKSLSLASSGQKSAGIYNLETAKLTSNWVVPPAQQYSPMTCLGMVFSSDGTELAGYFDDVQYNRFMAWGPGGKLIANALVPKRTPDSVAKPPLYQGRPLEWLPDKSGWMVYGHAIVDKQTGKLAWSIPSSPGDSRSEARRILDSGELLTVGGRANAPVLRSERLPLGEIAAAIQAVRSQK